VRRIKKLKLSCKKLKIFAQKAPSKLK
jgi:hypothetical protein